MSRAKMSFALAFVFVAACGGSDQPAPKAPEVEPIASGTPADMPAPPATTAAAASAAPTTDAPPPGVPDPSAAPATLSLPSATAKAALKGKKAANVELKSDGTVTNGGKAVAKVNGTKLETPDGKALLAVDKDAVNTGEGSAYGTFSGDELTLSKGGDKVAVGDDGKVTWTAGGKASDLGKFDGVGSAKRAAALAVAFVVAPPAAEKPTTVAKPAGGDKPAGDKPAAKPAAGGDKPAAKPAGKK